MFLWGYWSQQLPTYFSAFLATDTAGREVAEQALLITPMAEEFCHYWSGKYPTPRAPVLTKITVSGHPDRKDIILRTGESFTVNATVSDVDTPGNKLKYRWWILNSRGSAVVGPFNTDLPVVELKAPSNPEGNYCVMAYVISGNHLASGFTVPIKVEKSTDAPIAPSPVGSPSRPRKISTSPRT